MAEIDPQREASLSKTDETSSKTAAAKRKKKKNKPPVPKPDLSQMPTPRYSNFSFDYQAIAKISGLPEGMQQRARLGDLRTPHGSIATPNFIFCATKGSVKGLSVPQVKAAQTDIILSNTYHLMLNPGADLIAEMGGLHKFTGWNGPMLSDSGGYQVFAMGHGSVSEEVKGKRQAPEKQSILKISEAGVRFRSYLDGSKVELSPESSVDIQRKLGVDLMVQFDECTPFHASKDYTGQSMKMSLRWAERSLAEFIRGDDGRQAIYGVLQGGVFPEWRAESAAGLSRLPFFASAIGGCLGKTRKQMWEVVTYSSPLLPIERPIHLLGIGYIADIFYGVLQGIDTFDCVHPTRLARHGCAIQPYAHGYADMELSNCSAERRVQLANINIRKQRFKRDESPIAGESGLEELQYSKAYIQHLFRAGEMLGPQILSLNNVYQMNRLMRDIRRGLAEDRLDEACYFWLGLHLKELIELVENS